MRGESLNIAILDRDGVINEDKGYVHSWENFTFTHKCVDGLKLLQNSGYKIIIVTNQSGIARGYYTISDVVKLHNKLRHHLLGYGIHILDIFFCPHLKNGTVSNYAVDCACRKPNIGMLKIIMKKYNFHKSKSLVIGDRMSDMYFGYNYGIKELILVNSKASDNKPQKMRIQSFDSFYDAAKMIHQRSSQI